MTVFGNTVNGAYTTAFVNGYDEDGNALFQRSYVFTLLGGTKIQGFVDSPSTNEAFLELSSFNRDVPSDNYVYVDAIQFSNPTQDEWQSSHLTTSTGPLYLDSNHNLYLGSSSQLTKISAGAGNKGSILWTAPVPCNQIISGYAGPVVESYNSSTSQVTLTYINPADGSVSSSISFAAAGLGPIGLGIGYSTLFGGATTGSSPESLIFSAANGPALSNALCPASVVGGHALDLSVALDGPASTEVNLALTSSDTHVIPNQQLSLEQNTDFSLDTAPVDVDTPVTLTLAQVFPFVQRTATTVVKTATVASVKLVAASSGTATGTVTLTGPAGPSGKTVALSSNEAAVTVPASVTIASGAVSNTFTATIHGVSSTTTVTITAKLGGSMIFGSLVVSPAVLSSLVLTPNSVVGGDNVEALVKFNALAPPGGAVVTFKSNSVVATIPSTVTVPAGAQQLYFLVKSAKVTVATTVTITATFNSTSTTATLTVTP